jgi:hypothetical protein
LNGKDQETEAVNQGLRSDFYKQMKFNCEATRGPSARAAVATSLFEVHRWTFDVQSDYCKSFYLIDRTP